MTIVPKSGRKTSFTREASFRFEKSAGGWVIGALSWAR